MNKKCEDCGKIIKVRSPNHKYCDECSMIRRKKSHKKYRERPEIKERIRERNRNYHKTENGRKISRECVKRYLKTPKGKEKNREKSKMYQKKRNKIKKKFYSRLTEEEFFDHIMNLAEEYYQKNKDKEDWLHKKKRELGLLRRQK